MAAIRSERVPMNPQEQGAFERRIGRAYRDGVSMKEMQRRFGIGEGRITAIVKERFPDIPLRGARGAAKRKAGI
jgi:hypothetical protein